MRVTAFLYRAGHILVLLGIVNMLEGHAGQNIVTIGFALMILGLFVASVDADVLLHRWLAGRNDTEQDRYETARLPP